MRLAVGVILGELVWLIPIMVLAADLTDRSFHARKPNVDCRVSLSQNG